MADEETGGDGRAPQGEEPGRQEEIQSQPVDLSMGRRDESLEAAGVLSSNS